MTETSGAAAESAPAATEAAPTTGTQAAPQPGTADQSAEAMLAAAVSAPEGDGDGDAAPDPAKQLADAQKNLAHWQKQARTWETRAKGNDEAAKKLAEIEEASKTEAQRLADRAAAAEKRAAEAEALYHRTLAAATYSLPPSLIDRIAGSTEAEITESAEELAAAINERVAEQVAALQAGNGSRPAASAKPVESLRPGAIPASDAAAPRNPEALFRQLIDGRK